MGLASSTSTYNPECEIPDLTGQVFLVTGANSGLGYETTRQLTAHGATVYLGCRSKDRAEEAVRRIESSIPSSKDSGRLPILQIDMADTHSVRRAAKEFMQREQRLDVLIHNAGRLANNYELSREGVELTVAVNHLGVAVLTQELMPVLKQTAAQPDSDVRIIVVASMSYMYGPSRPKFDTLDDWNSYGGYTSNFLHIIKHQRYAITKRMNLLWALHQQKLLDEENESITVMSLHPGFVLTNGILATSPWWLTLSGLLGFALSLEKGAWTTLCAATHPKVKENRDEYKGSYLVPFGKVKQPVLKDAYDPQRAKDLWDATEKISAELLAKPDPTRAQSE